MKWKKKKNKKGTQEEMKHQNKTCATGETIN